MSKITIVTIRNPFDLNDREIKELSHVPGEAVGHYLRTVLFPADPGVELAVSLNGAVLSAEEYGTIQPASGDFIVLCPVVGKSDDAQKTISFIAAVVMTMMGYGYGAENFWKTAFSAESFKQALIINLGGLLVNYLAQPKIDQPKQPKATYSWGQLQSLQGQGNAVALTYGKVRTAGQIVAQHVESVGDKQYLNLLLCGGEGELDYLNGITNIKINKSELKTFGDVSSYSTGDPDDGIVEYYGPLNDNQRKLEVHKRFGTNTQKAISAFGDTYFDLYPGIELTSNENMNQWQTVATEGDNGTKLEVTVECPSGLYRMSNGDLKEAWFKMEIEYQREGKDPDWKQWINPENDGLIKGSQYEPVRKSYLLDLQERCRVHIRCKCVAVSGSAEDNHSTRTYLSCVSHIATEDFIRPGKALLGIRALATDRISGGTPAVTWEQSRTNVWVCIDPVTNDYQPKPATNPAWVCYDLIHRAKWLKNPNTNIHELAVKGVPASRIDYAAFARWADFCDKLNLEVNLLIDTTDDLWRTLSKVEIIGRGKVVLKGTRYSCVCDCESDPVQLFTMGNIVKDSFSEEFLPMQDRADAIEVSFLNQAKDYQRDIITVYEEGADLHQANITQISLDGVTDLALACQEAKYRLRANKYLTRTISFEADVDAIACQVGDVILFQHDLPEWGNGGRVLAVSENSVTLDRKVRLEEGKSYRIMFRSSNPADPFFVDPFHEAGPDRLIEFEVDTTAVAGTIETDTPTLVTTGIPLPVRYDLYAVGEVSKVAKPFRVTRITRSKEFQRRISAIEYDQRIINGDDDGPLPVIHYEAAALGIGGLTASSHQDVQGDTWLDLSWKPLSRYGGAKVLIAEVKEEEPGGASLAETVGIQKSSYSHRATPGRTYSIQIHPFDLFGNDLESEEVTYTVPAKLAPAEVTGIALDEDTYVKSDGTVVTNLLLSFAKPGRPQTAFEIWYDRNGDENWRYDQRITDNQCVLRNMPNSGAIRVKVIACDQNDPLLRSGGAISEPFPITGKSQPPSDVASDTFGAVQDELNRSIIQLSWQSVDLETNPDLKGYELRLGPDWGTGTGIGGVIQDIKASYTIPINHANPPSGTFTFWIKTIDNSGNHSINPAYAALYAEVRPNAPTQKAIYLDPNNTTYAALEWNGVADKDLIAYEIKSGNDWETAQAIGSTKETMFRFKLEKSGTYNFMIRSRNVAGYYSSILNMGLTASVEPPDVEGFSVEQQNSDRSKIRFTWGKPESLDVQYFEIREGLSWDEGEAIATGITGTAYDGTITGEMLTTWWIAAISSGGIYSQNPAKCEGIFNLNPGNPHFYKGDPDHPDSVQQDPSDRATLIITWEGVPEADISQYILKVGSDWDNALEIIKTKELRAIWNPPASGDYKFLLKAKNNAGYYSDEVSTEFPVVVEPAKVSGFSAVQNGVNVLMSWQKSPEPDVVGYEIHEGSAFDDGALVATGITGTFYQTPVDTEKNYRFHIKAINRAGRYSQSAARASVTINNLPPRNVVETFDEIHLQDGIHENTEFGPSQFNFSNLGGKFEDYPNTRLNEVGGQIVLKLKEVDGVFPESGVYTCQSRNMGRVITANISSQFVSSVLLRSGGSAKLQYHSSLDPNGEDWTGWVDFMPVQITFQHIQFRVLLSTSDAARTPQVNVLQTMVDVPDVDKYGTAIIPTGGTAIPYGHTYYRLPTVVPMAIGQGFRAELLNVFEERFEVKVLDIYGNDVGGGTINWFARGY